MCKRDCAQDEHCRLFFGMICLIFGKKEESMEIKYFDAFIEAMELINDGIQIIDASGKLYITILQQNN